MSTGVGGEPLRVLAATLRYPPYVAGGYELLTRDAVEGLRARGHPVDVLAGRGAHFGPDVLPWLEPALPEPGAGDDLFRRSFEASNLERVRMHVLSFANLAATRRALGRTGAELLFFFNLGLVSLAPILAARLAGVPTLGYVSDPWPTNHWLGAWRASGAKPLRAGLFEQLWRGFRELVVLGPLLVPSEFLRRRLVDDGIPAADVTVVPLGLSREVEERARDDAPRPRRRGERLRVASASMLWPGKGVHVLLEAAALAVAQGADLELVVAGTGDEEYRAELARLADAPALAGRVRFAGMLARDALGAELRASHAFAFPSTWGEPFALAPLEAMAHGLALVASDAGGTPEQLDDGRQGLVVPAGDVAALAGALVRLARDDDERMALATAGRARVFERFTHARFCEGIERAALAAAGRGPSGAAR